MNQETVKDCDKKIWEKPDIKNLDFRRTEGGPSPQLDEGAEYGTHSIP